MYNDKKMMYGDDEKACEDKQIKPSAEPHQEGDHTLGMDSVLNQIKILGGYGSGRKPKFSGSKEAAKKLMAAYAKLEADYGKQ